LLLSFLEGRERDEVRRRRLYGRLPTNPRCVLCYAPFDGVGAKLMRMRGRRPFAKNPRVCDVCFRAMAVGDGCEVNIAVLFVDVRGSMTLASRLGPSGFARLLDRYYRVASDEMIAHQAFVELTGDEVYGFYLPGLISDNAVRVAVKTAERILRRVTWLELGSGVHAGIAWVGVVGDAQKIKDFRSVGDTVNLGARLVQRAGPGECLISEVAYREARLESMNLPECDLTLKGIREPVAARVMSVATGETHVATT